MLFRPNPLVLVTLLGHGVSAFAAKENIHNVNRNLQQSFRYECQLSAPMALSNDEDLFLEQVQNAETGTYTMRLIYTGGQSWIGIGVNSEGKSKMTPSMAVIGRADDPATGGASVLHYNMDSDAEDASGVKC